MYAPRYFGSRYFGRRYFPKGSTVAASSGSNTSTANKFRSAIVPDFKDLAEVQRFLQRTIDEIARSHNPVRTVTDGGTGFTDFQPGELLVAGEDGKSFTRVPPNLSTTRMALVSVGTGSTARAPFWEAQAADVAAGTNVVASGVLVTASGVQVIIP